MDIAVSVECARKDTTSYLVRTYSNTYILEYALHGQNGGFSKNTFVNIPNINPSSKTFQFLISTCLHCY